MSVFKEWICVFPGKMNICWKSARGFVGTREEAEIEALNYCNVVAVPLALFENMQEHNHQLVIAERDLSDLRFKPWKLYGSDIY